MSERAKYEIPTSLPIITSTLIDQPVCNENMENTIGMLLLNQAIKNKVLNNLTILNPNFYNLFCSISFYILKSLPVVFGAVYLRNEILKILAHNCIKEDPP